MMMTFFVMFITISTIASESSCLCATMTYDQSKCPCLLGMGAPALTPWVNTLKASIGECKTKIIYLISHPPKEQTYAMSMVSMNIITNSSDITTCASNWVAMATTGCAKYPNYSACKNYNIVKTVQEYGASVNRIANTPISDKSLSDKLSVLIGSMNSMIKFCHIHIGAFLITYI